MRSVAYVDDALGILPWARLADAVPVYRAIRDAEPPRSWSPAVPPGGDRSLTP